MAKKALDAEQIDRKQLIELRETVERVFPGAIAIGILELGDTRKICKGMVANQTGRHDCGNQPAPGGILCAGPCRAQGRGW